MATGDTHVSLELATQWARSNCEWEKVYRYLFLHPQDFFVIQPNRKWSIAHQVVYHGDVDLFKRMLALFSNDQIDIHSKSKDGKTLLDVAKEKESEHPAMVTYVAHLILQDELMQDANESNWRSVKSILEQDKNLANEKPPYSPYFLLHYVVENGDADILQDLLDNFQFLTNVINIKNETPLDMALRLKKYDIGSILGPRTVVRQPFSQSQRKTSLTEPLFRANVRSASRSSIQLSNDSISSQISSSMPIPPSRSVDPKTKPPGIGFSSLALDISGDGDFTVGSSGLYDSISSPPMYPPQLPRQSSTEIKHVRTKRSIVSQYSLPSFDPLPQQNLPPPPPPPPTTSSASNEQLMKNLTCTLTQQIFEDPVIATDGQTYERTAIIDWVNVYHCSPTTGAPMDKTFRDNTQIKLIIQSMQQQN